MAFIYKPLEFEVGYIRLLTLKPSPDPLANIECTITHDAVGQAKYTALSYTWGDLQEKQSITLNCNVFTVTKNLLVALQHLRSENESLTLWIDAICINQEDIDERTQQVKQMVEIYKNATQVFIWMGEEIENFDAAISLMNRCKQAMDPGGFGIEGLVHFADSKFRREGWDALAKLLERPWFSRVWIIQEAVYGKDPIVVCGKHRFPWHLLQFFGESREIWNRITWKLLEEGKMFYSGHFVHASDRLDFICSVRAGCPLGWQSLKGLLSGVRTSEATDPRDKVFAMLDLLKDDFQLCEVNYRKSVREVYVEAAASILKHTESLHFLSWTHKTFGRRGSNRPAELPSWTPSWSSAENELMELQSFDEASFTKHAMQEVAEQIEEHENTLSVAEAMQEAIEAHKKEQDSDPASLIQSLQEILKSGPEVSKQKKGSMYPDEASFMLDVQNRAYYLNTSNKSTAWKTLLGPSGPSKRVYWTTGNSLSCGNCNVQKGTLRVFGAAIDVLEDVSPPCTPSFPLDGPPCAWIKTVLAKKLGLPISSNAMDSDSDSDDETTMALEFYPLFWRIILADQWQGMRLKKGNSIEIPGVSSIPPNASDMDGAVKELFKVRGAVTSFENQAAFTWRALFTSKKSVGLSPIGARKGDIIFAVFGCDVPYLVRKSEKGYLFLGEW